MPKQTNSRDHYHYREQPWQNISPANKHLLGNFRTVQVWVTTSIIEKTVKVAVHFLTMLKPCRGSWKERIIIISYYFYTQHIWVCIDSDWWCQVWRATFASFLPRPLQHSEPQEAVARSCGSKQLAASNAKWNKWKLPAVQRNVAYQCVASSQSTKEAVGDQLLMVFGSISEASTCHWHTLDEACFLEDWLLQGWLQ